MRTLIIVSPHFPPSGLAGVHRARHLAKHLPAHGWRPIVITVHERHYAERLDPALAARAPPDLELIKTGALPTRFSRVFGVGDIGLRGYPFLRAAVGRAAAAYRPDAVLITGSPFYPMLMAPWIRRRLGLPVVLDFQDPWVSAWGAQRRPLTKAWASHRLALALEPRVARAASFVTSVSEVQNAQFAGRYPWFDPSRLAAIPIGGDPEDFISAPSTARTAKGSAERASMIYVGAYWPKMEGPLRAFFRALARLRSQHPEIATGLSVRFLGTDSRAAEESVQQVAPIARQERVGDLVTEDAARLPFGAALTAMAGADALLLIGSDEPHYTASKIYPALLSGRPWLSLFHSASNAHRILNEAGGGRAIGFADEAELQASVPALTEALIVLATRPEALGAARPEAIAPYTAHAIAGQFADVFDKVAGA